MKELYGITVAMVTPFTEDNQVDYAGVKQLTRMLVDKGVNCLYPCGTTGEMFRMSMEERKKIAKTVVETTDHQVTVFIHCGAMNQEDTIKLVKYSRDIGADGAGVVTPVFFSVNDRELEEYYVAVADATPDFPVYLYNIPQCASNDIKVLVAQRIAARCNNVVGVKYSYADINRTIDYIGINNGTFSVLHGCDRALISMLAAGCKGTVSGISGVFPEPFVNAYAAYCGGDLALAQKHQKNCVKLVDALQGGSNMSYFKEALKMRGIAGGFMRKPQLDLPADEVARLHELLEGICEDAGITIKL
jgi:dihydrodipicolinate synthase/N-acetylneuraminate lyase